MYLSSSDRTKKSTVSDKARSRVSFSCPSRLLSPNDVAPSKSACACGGTCPRCQKQSDGVKREPVPDMEQKNGATNSAAPNPADTDDDERCPTQTIQADDASCSIAYGANMRLCYARAGYWWSREEVTQGASDNPCDKKNIHQAREAEQFTETGCTNDAIMNYNGLPQFVAPCKHVTRQTIFLGPTKHAAEEGYCKYENEQVIEVTLDKKDTPKAGKVITTSGSTSTSCNWEEKVFK
jgi:hypothetical protein